MDRLEAASALAMALGEPVEQLRMRGGLAVEAEVAWGGDEAPAEVIVPGAIDHHARGQGIGRVADPARQGPSAIGLGGIRRDRHRGPDGRERGRGHDLGLLHGVAATEQVRRAGLRECPRVNFPPRVGTGEPSPKLGLAGEELGEPFRLLGPGGGPRRHAVA